MINLTQEQIEALKKLDPTTLNDMEKQLYDFLMSQINK